MNDASPPQPVIDGATRLLGIVGDPIEQVKSPLVFNPRFKAAGVNAVLVPFHVPADAFEPSLRGLMALGNLDGLIVTVPYKTRALSLVDEVLPTGRNVGAINAIRREKDGRWTGDMFDGRGLVRGLAAENISIAGRRTMLIGAGGAGSAVAFAFAEAGAAALTIHDIDATKAQSLVARLQKAFPACLARTGAPQAAGHDVIINATPIGMAEGEGLPAPLGWLEASQLVIDVIAKPEVTPLLAEARARGCRTVGGKAMLDGQVAELEKFFRIGG
ncbi:MAG: shikimate dehydrogenase [Hyphomicrobiales bacterium]|nr:shikimate dehydrogenase [Hyphomicrobiales bacterium]